MCIKYAEFILDKKPLAPPPPPHNPVYIPMLLCLHERGYSTYGCNNLLWAGGWPVNCNFGGGFG